jgi:hypothetical protein
MSVLRDVLDASEREGELRAGVQAALKDWYRLNSKTALEARDEQGLTPELVAAMWRYIHALRARGEHMVQQATHLEENMRAVVAKQADEER